MMTTPMSKSALNWQEHYLQLKRYIEQHHQLPEKRREDTRALLNWWKYNRKCLKAGKLQPERARLLQELSDMRCVRRVTF